MSQHDDACRILSASANWAEDLLDATLGDAQAICDLLLARFPRETLLDAVHAVIAGGASTRASFLFCARHGRHPLLALAHALPADGRHRLIADLAGSQSIYIPYDLRAAAFAAWSHDRDDGADTARLHDLAAMHPQTRYKDLAAVSSNDIDHDFEIPDDRAQRNAVLLDAARTAMMRDRARLARRALGAAGMDPPASAPFAPAHVYLPADVEKVFEPFASPGIQWRDFVVEWNEIVTTTPDEAYTTAEILRLLLLDPDYHLPGRRQRAVADAVHLNLLRTFSGAILGLRSGVLFVEHGFRPEASFFLFGEGAILGKACVLDGTGVVVVEPHAFLGGGLSPILIHTHKHEGGGGSAERKIVRPVGFRARRAARLPMSFVGLLEVADLSPDRWPGVERIAVEIRPRADIWGETERARSTPPP